MAADLPVSLHGSGIVEEVCTLDDGVHAVALAQPDHGKLELAFLFQCEYVREQVDLQTAVVPFDIVGADPDAPDKEQMIDRFSFNRQAAEKLLTDDKRAVPSEDGAALSSL